ncbi:hypothetical protein JAAARDRAFT_187641 [Jaapia argillacea MUCL 33604]|uniref:Mitochondrial import receptor subunit TOM20 n=1 Tax=Jaapia argillacea MUCL 33604 TaxID=933084 RepID=A0A067QNT3_9AGAM|nr:hypothetical protein JAAARDRAFT_187641 [Jaapia argillacea MUCL 33604]
MSSRTATTALAVAGLTLSGLVAYAIYFDYRRRTDAAFRKKLRKEKKKVDKQAAQSKDTESPTTGVGADELRAALEKVRSEDVPTTANEREQYFMAQVGMGEQLCAQGPVFNLPAALCFYRALRVYPSPVELIVIYQKTVPEPVFKIVMEMTNMDVSETPSSAVEKEGEQNPVHSENEDGESSPVRGGPPSEASSQEWDNVTDPGSQTPATSAADVKDRVEGYYTHFPPASFNVKVKTIDVADGATSTKKKILVADKDFKAGEVIYKEQPVVAMLDLDLQGQESHCSHCLRQIEKGMAIRPEDDRLNSVYCSKDCQVRAKSQTQNILFGSESLLPAELAPEIGPKDERTRAQSAYVEYIKRAGKGVPLLVASFVARQVATETAKMIPGGTGGGSPLAADPLTESGDYSFYDHIERLRYLEVPASEEEMQLLREVLKTALPGLEGFITEERHATLTGKMAYNAIGVCIGGGRDDKPVSDERPEDTERTRTPYGTSRQIGCGYYAVSSYITHSCEPSARPSFSSGTSELNLIAIRDLKAGDEITMAYVDVTQHVDEEPLEARRRRRMELARGWRFACTCSRCAADGPSTSDSSGEEELVGKDESKVEGVVERVEGV